MRDNVGLSSHGEVYACRLMIPHREGAAAGGGWDGWSSCVWRPARFGNSSRASPRRLRVRPPLMLAPSDWPLCRKCPLTSACNSPAHQPYATTDTLVTL